MQSACTVLYCHVWRECLYHIFLHYLKTGKILIKKSLLNIIYVFWFSLQMLSETFFMPRRIQRDIILNVHKSSRKVLSILVIFEWTLIFLGRFSKNLRISNLMKNHPVGTELSHAGGQTDQTWWSQQSLFAVLRTRLKTTTFSGKNCTDCPNFFHTHTYKWTLTSTDSQLHNIPDPPRPRSISHPFIPTP
jgi:hypothetical protein